MMKNHWTRLRYAPQLNGKNSCKENWNRVKSKSIASSFSPAKMITHYIMKCLPE